MFDANDATVTVTNRMKTDAASCCSGPGWSDVCIIMHLHLHPHIVTMLQLTNKLCDDKIRIL